jgi:hypothetical protein
LLHRRAIIAAARARTNSVFHLFYKMMVIDIGILKKMMVMHFSNPTSKNAKAALTIEDCD